jgi:hypothetical protein
LTNYEARAIEKFDRSPAKACAKHDLLLHDKFPVALVSQSRSNHDDRVRIDPGYGY